MRKIVLMLVLGAVVFGAGATRATRIQDVTRLKGDQSNELVGIGLVFGLKGTGDGGDFAPAMRPLQAMLAHFQDGGVVAKELKNANNVAIVMLSATVPAAGGHAGDKVDVKVSAIAAKSLKGGRLFVVPLQSADPSDNSIYALASGDVMLDDESVPTQATIRAGKTGGAKLEADFKGENYAHGRFTLVLQAAAASLANSTAIADQINDDVSTQTDGATIATAQDATTVEVVIPKAELARPTQFVARVQQLPVPVLPGVARVVVNSKTKTIVFTGDVELSPTVLSHNGLTITVPASNVPATPAGTQVPFVLLEPGKEGAATSAKLRDLINAFNLLNVPAADRISIVKELHESGALHCQLEMD